MKPEFWALLTALCWAVGSLLEKTGVKTGNFTPVMDTAIRTGISLFLLFFISMPYWGELKVSGFKPILMIAFGGGFLAGALGIICLYTGLKSGHITTVMTIAFCMAPIFGGILGAIVLKEKLNLPQYFGITMCIAGAGLTVYFK